MDKKQEKQLYLLRIMNMLKKIYDVFNKEYPHLAGYAKVIDNYINYAQSAIDEFF